jgi:hypothetical protein
MILNYLRQINQEVTKKQLKESMIVCYNNICFSTFPYISYKLLLSKDTIQQYNSGNCIALTYFLKIYLKKNYNLDSFIIPSSVPNCFRIKDQEKICHCALFVPKNKYEYFILDCAFYLNDPIYVNVNNINYNSIISTNIHHDENKKILYQSIESNESQMLSDIYGCVCFFEDNPNDKWTYFMNEIINPDETIGFKYHCIKKEPFLIKTIYKNEKISLEYHLKKSNNQLILIEPNNVINYYDINNFPSEKKHIFTYLSKYF